MNRYVCSICGFVYEEAAGIPASGIAPGTKWEALPDDWVCPWCKAAKSEFRLQDSGDQEEDGQVEKEKEAKAAEEPSVEEREGELRKLTIGEMSAYAPILQKDARNNIWGKKRSFSQNLPDI